MMPPTVEVRSLLASGAAREVSGCWDILCSSRVSSDTWKTSLSCELTMSALCYALIKSFLKACSRMVMATLYTVGRTGNSRIKHGGLDPRDEILTH